MDINASYINNLNVQATSLERISSASAINSASDNASGLAIADALQVQESSISQALENMNSGIAMSNIAQSGLANQQDILESINTLTLQAMNGTVNEEGRQTIANQISKYIDQFENIANSTTYNGQELLKTSGDANDDISIADSESIINMQKVDTSTISNQLKSFLDDFSTSNTAMNSMLQSTQNAQGQLSSYASDFASSANAMESNARNALSAETNIAAARSSIMDIDYGNEISDFSKSNILNQIGTIMQSQANAIQARNISLLT